ncbi:glycosyltransferase [Mycolicibacterium sp.]|uniref:glycosyltransferase n=1 Tax=Mycolicibacterium sp. TaxID=2320850 RepID=UPI0028AB034F|nr:glycosyltransferase [Mycolicibacterium sp.]
MSITGRASAERSVLAWHVHGSWMESFVAGRHRYLLPVTPERDAFGLGRCGRDWPNTVEVPVDRLADNDVDLVVLQRPEEIELTERWLRRRPGIDVPAVFVEHNAPRPHPCDSVHPLADRHDIRVVHVTDFNRLMWDNGRAPTTVIDHGIADPGQQYRGEIPHAATMINEPLRRGRVVGTDLLATLGETAPVDVWGIGTEALNERRHRHGGVTGMGDVARARLLPAVAQRRVYLHTARWTSLGVSLVEAMFLGMPVVAVASTMTPLAVPAEAGVVSADPDLLAAALAHFLSDRAAAEVAGKVARCYAQSRFGLDRFLADWEDVMAATCR